MSEKRERQATLVLFKSTSGSSKLHGSLEVINDLPAGTKLHVQVYDEVSKGGSSYLRGALYIEDPKPSIID